MKTAYFDCLSGISGDMTLGALVDAGADLDRINQGVQSLGLAGVRITAGTVRKQGFRALQIDVEHEPEHTHRHLHQIEAMIDRGALSARARELSKSIFRLLAEAEAKVHGTTIEKVHFHEVGAVDSISDIVGTAIALDLLQVNRVVASSVPTGTGYVTIAHGRVSIPAPATAELLRGALLANSPVAAELTTPTGAAILAALAASYGSLPAMRVEAVGYGAGKRDLDEQPNVLRVIIGTSSERVLRERLCVVETNIDDAPGEWIGRCVERLWTVGVLDVFTTPIQMKKNRPGVLLSVLCRPAEVEAVEALLFAETTTLGVRCYEVWRRAAARRRLQVETPWGTVEGVEATDVAPAPRFSPEYESCRTVADVSGQPFRRIFEAALAAYAARKRDVPGGSP